MSAPHASVPHAGTRHGTTWLPLYPSAVPWAHLPIPVSAAAVELAKRRRRRWHAAAPRVRRWGAGARGERAMATGHAVTVTRGIRQEPHCGKELRAGLKGFHSIVAMR